MLEGENCRVDKHTPGQDSQGDEAVPCRGFVEVEHLTGVENVGLVDEYGDVGHHVQAHKDGELDAGG